MLTAQVNGIPAGGWFSGMRAPGHVDHSHARVHGNHSTLEAVFNKISRLALGILSALYNPTFFAYSMFSGLVFGCGASVYAYYNGVRSQGHHIHVSDSCGQGWMQFLAGRHFPEWTAQVVSTAFIGVHIKHEPRFFIPFTGLFLGYGAGYCAGTTLTDFL